MSFVSMMWTVWAALVAITGVMYFYRASLNRDEADQIFLDDSFDHEKTAQEAIVAKVRRIEPVVRVAQWLVVAMTLVVIGYYVRDILVHLDIIS